MGPHHTLNSWGEADLTPLHWLPSLGGDSTASGTSRQQGPRATCTRSHMHTHERTPMLTHARSHMHTPHSTWCLHLGLQHLGTAQPTVLTPSGPDRHPPLGQGPDKYSRLCSCCMSLQLTDSTRLAWPRVERGDKLLTKAAMCPDGFFQEAKNAFFLTASELMTWAQG